MKHNVKYLPLVLLGSLLTNETLSKVHTYGSDIEDVWEDMDMLMRENFNQMSRMAKQFNQLTMDDEDAVTFAKYETVQLPKVTSQVNQDDNNVILKISIEAPEGSKVVSDKKEITKENKVGAKVEKKQEVKKEDYLLKKDKIVVTPDDNKLEVNISLANSYVKVYVDKNHYSIIKGTSSQKEQKDDKSTSFSSSSFEKLVKNDYLPHAVNIVDPKNIKVKADETSNTLTITIAKKKTAKINVE